MGLPACCDQGARRIEHFEIAEINGDRPAITVTLTLTLTAALAGVSWIVATPQMNKMDVGVTIRLRPLTQVFVS